MPEAPAFFKPFFFTMKLAPINKLEDKARIKPLMLSEDMPLYESLQLIGLWPWVAMAWETETKTLSFAHTLGL